MVCFCLFHVFCQTSQNFLASLKKQNESKRFLLLDLRRFGQDTHFCHRVSQLFRQSRSCRAALGTRVVFAVLFRNAAISSGQRIGTMQFFIEGSSEGYPHSFTHLLYWRCVTSALPRANNCWYLNVLVSEDNMKHGFFYNLFDDCIIAAVPSLSQTNSGSSFSLFASKQDLHLSK
jgi:hypothetical protein